MTSSILRIVAAGIIGGIVLFIIPFLLFKLFFFVLFAGLIFRLFVGRNRHFGDWRHQHRFHERFDPYEVITGKEGLRDTFHQHPKQV